MIPEEEKRVKIGDVVVMIQMRDRITNGKLNCMIAYGYYASNGIQRKQLLFSNLIR
jgi:hypothetical protein